MRHTVSKRLRKEAQGKPRKYKKLKRDWMKMSHVERGLVPKAKLTIQS